MSESKKMVFSFLGLVLLALFTFTIFLRYVKSFARDASFDRLYTQILSKVDDTRFTVLVPELKEKQCNNSTDWLGQSDDFYIEMSVGWSKNLLGSGLLNENETTRVKTELAVKGYVSCFTAYETTKAVAERLLVEKLDELDWRI